MSSTQFVPTRDQQARFALAMLANFGQWNPDATSTLTQINTALGQLKAAIGTWNVIWGPAYCRLGSSTQGADNLMFVARQAGTSNYVIAIAGTNASCSSIDLLGEDLNVCGTVPWVLGGAPLGAAVSNGTFLGLSNLISTPGTYQVSGNPVNVLTDCLGAESRQGPLSICVSGHSLGGALAPTLALFLQNIQGSWDLSGSSTVSTQPMAAPTPGNQLFAQFSDSQLTTGGFYNTLDVIPHVWASSDLDQIPLIYAGASLPDPLGILIALVAVGYIKSQTQGLGYTHSQYRTPLPGSLNPDKFFFLDQAAYQHIYAYDGLFDLGTYTSVLHPVPPPNTYMISTSAATTAQSAGNTLPSNIQIATPPTTQSVTVGKLTFQVPASADAEVIRRAVKAMAPYFGDAIGV